MSSERIVLDPEPSTIEQNDSPQTSLSKAGVDHDSLVSEGEHPSPAEAGEVEVDHDVPVQSESQAVFSEEDWTEVDYEPSLETEVAEGLSLEEEEGLPDEEAETEAEYDSFLEQALTEEFDYLRPKRGDIRRGVIISISSHEVIVDIGLKREGTVPESDLDRLGEEALAELTVGQEVPVYVLKPVDRSGEMIVSLHRARMERDWLRAQELLASGEIWEGEVQGHNKGGLVIPFGKVRGFLPASQVSGFPRRPPREERMTKLAEMEGRKLLLKVIEVDRARRRLIFSERLAYREKRRRQREQLFEELREGEVRRGVVSSLCHFGAFIDLGGADGLIHISELSWERVNHPRELLQVGDEVEVYVLRLDRERRRIGLSIKRLEPEPWSTVEERYSVGQLVEGTVTNVTDFGAFARIEPGIEGLIHISELSDGHVDQPDEVVQVGDILLLRIIKLDSARRRLGLSLKRISEAERARWLAEIGEIDEDRVSAEITELEPVGLESAAQAEETEIMALDADREQEVGWEEDSWRD